jgi:hypothetical protein
MLIMEYAPYYANYRVNVKDIYLLSYGKMRTSM